MFPRLLLVAVLPMLAVGSHFVRPPGVFAFAVQTFGQNGVDPKMSLPVDEMFGPQNSPEPPPNPFYRPHLSNAELALLGQLLRDEKFGAQKKPLLNDLLMRMFPGSQPQDNAEPDVRTVGPDVELVCRWLTNLAVRVQSLEEENRQLKMLLENEGVEPPARTLRPPPKLAGMHQLVEVDEWEAMQGQSLSFQLQWMITKISQRQLLTLAIERQLQLQREKQKRMESDPAEDKDR